jgi:flagellar assembly factor FliW
VGTLVSLLMVSVHRTPGKTVLTVNARAPLLIDSQLRLAAQYVFQSDRYDVQHVITA